MQLQTVKVLGKGLKGLYLAKGRVALREASQQVSGVYNVAKPLAAIKSAQLGSEKIVARAENYTNLGVRVVGLAGSAWLGPEVGIAANASAPWLGRAAGNFTRSYLVSRDSEDTFNRLVASADTIEKYEARQQATYRLAKEDPRLRPSDPNGASRYVAVPAGKSFVGLERRKPVSEPATDQISQQPYTSEPRLAQDNSRHQKSSTNTAIPRTSGPEWSGLTQPKTTAPEQKGPKGASNKTTNADMTVSAAPSVVRNESSKPPISATALPEGGIRRAPSLTYQERSNSSQLAMAAPSNNLSSGRNVGSGPGGISLTRAASEKLNLNIDFDGAFFADGRIVLSGRPQAKGIDAAIFLTSLRLACESGDPSFSLDPDDGQAWTEEGRKLSEVVWTKLRPRVEPRASPRKPSGLTIRVFSARKEYGNEWPKMLSGYPNFKTRLVFKPEWLRETRLGEVLYKADVLLKELTSGTPTLRPDPRLRGATIDNYIPSDSRSVARSLLTLVERGGKADAQVGWRGNRLWFDLVAQKDSDLSKGQGNQTVNSFAPPRTDAGNALFQLLRQRNYVNNESIGFTKTSLVIENGNALDLSQIHPQMFVRVHDTASGNDLPGSDPDLDVLSADVNRRIEKYAAAYQELRDLTDVFRAYVVASKYSKLYPHACKNVSLLSLLPAEKTDRPLPEHHVSELFITLGTFETSRRWTSVTSRSINGGIALRGKLFSEQRTAAGRPTPVTLELKQEVEVNKQKDSWQSISGRQFIALKVGREDVQVLASEPRPVTGAPIDILQASGTIGRFDVYRDARISGTKLKSTPLQTKYSKDPVATMGECMRVCSSDSNCVAFEIDPLQNQCSTYSTVLKATPDPHWAHGIWR